MFLKKLTVVVMFGIAFGGATTAANANLLVNAGFNGPYGDPNYHLKERFSEIQPLGWFGGDKLTYLCMSTNPSTGSPVNPSIDTVFDNNGGLTVWTSPGPAPDGGNYIIADADPTYSDTFYQTINNLTIGKEYAVTFYQASGENVDQIGMTTEQWKVGFGLGGQTQYQLSDLMTTPSKGAHPWESQSLVFIANSTSATVSFLAYGGPGGQPPVSYLNAVSVDLVGNNVVPEPSSLAISGVGLIGLAVLRRFRRAKPLSN
jgi:hypothetical protein